MPSHSNFVISPPNQQAMWAVHQRMAIPPIMVSFPRQLIDVWSLTIPKYSGNVLKQLLAFDVPQVWDCWTHSFYASSTVCVCSWQCLAAWMDHLEHTLETRPYSGCPNSSHCSLYGSWVLLHQSDVPWAPVSTYHLLSSSGQMRSFLSMSLYHFSYQLPWQVALTISSSSIPIVFIIDTSS